MGLVLSGDGQFAYVSSGRFGGDNAISAFKFDENGRLSLVQEIVSGEDGLTGFSGGNEITISPDGRNVYAAATNSGSVACLLRSPRSGRLRVLETITEDHDRLAGAAGICTSPDGKFVYVAAERGSMISIFHRDCDEE